MGRLAQIGFADGLILMDALEESPAKKMRQGCTSPHELDSLLMAKMGPSDSHVIRKLTPEDIGEFLEAAFLDEPVALSLAAFLGRDSADAKPVAEDCCGHLFAENELIYHCKDCAVDETCVLCAQCFQYADHEDHDFKYYQSRGLGGSCDCGEAESWKIPLTCPKHGMHSDNVGVDFDVQEPVASTPLERTILERSAKFFPVVVATMSNYVGKLMQSELVESAIETDASPHLCVVVFNDEVHSFPEVISTLKRIVRISEGEATKLAALIDEQGFATVGTYRLADLDRAQKVVSRIEETGLRTLLMDPRTVVMMMALDGMLSFLLSSAKKHHILKKRVIEVMFKADVDPQVDDSNLLARYFRYENHMNKWFKKRMQELFTLSLVSQRAKAKLMKCFAHYSGQLVLEMIEQPQLDYTLSILHFSVQIFTVPSIADLACRGGELERLVENVCKCVQHASERDFLSKEAMQGVVMLVSMLNYVVTDSAVAERGLLINETFCRLLCQCLWSFQNFRTYRKQTDEHVLYDDEDIINIITLTAHFGESIDEFVNSISDADRLRQFLKLALEFANEKMSLDPVLEGVNMFSFQQPLLWLVGALLDRHSFIAECPLTSVDQSPAVVKAAARCITILCQIEAGMWVRNGRSVIAQGMFCMRHISIWQKYMTICWHALASKSCSLSALLDYLLVPVSLQISREEPLERPKYFKLLLEYVVLGLLYGTYVGLDHKQYSESFLIHRLASGPASYSEVVDSLPEFLQKSKGNDALLGEVAEIQESDTPFDTSLYRLRRSAAGHFNMFFIGLLEPARTSALENMKSSYGFDPISWILSDEARSGTQGHLCSVLGGVEGIAGMQGLIDGLCKILHRGQFFIDLTALLVFLRRCAPGTAMDIDQPGLQQIYSAIEGLGGTGWSLQVIQVFCQTVKGFDKSQCIPETREKVETRSGIATRKKQQVLEAFKGRQQTFQDLNSDALLNVDEGIQDPEDYEMVLSGQCVYCQERADRDTEKYGVFGCVDSLNLYDAGSSSFNSCLHLIHVECFKKVRAARQQFCPLCKSLGFRLYLVCPKPRSSPYSPNPVDFPYDGCDDIASLGNEQHERSKVEGEQGCSMPSSQEYFIDRGAMVGILAGWVQQYYLLQELGVSSETAHLERMGRFLNAHEGALSPAATNHSPNAQAKDGIGAFFAEYLLKNYAPHDLTLEAYGRVLRAARSLVLHRLKTTWDDSFWDSYQWLLTDCSVVMGLVSLRFELDLPHRNECVHLVFGSLISADAQPQELISTLLINALSRPIDLAQVPCKTGERRRLVFMDLPRDYKDLFLRLSDEGSSCKCTRGRKSHICVYCEGFFCGAPDCSNFYINHSCNSQYQIYLNVHRCSIEIKYRRALFQVPAPYANRHGEPDPGFRRGGPLYLSEAKWRNLEKIYIAGGLANFLARNSDYDVRFQDFELEVREMARREREGFGLDRPRLVADF